MTILAPFDRKIPTPEDMKFERKNSFELLSSFRCVNFEIIIKFGSVLKKLTIPDSLPQRCIIHVSHLNRIGHVVFNKLKLLIVITLVERHTDGRRIPLAIGTPKLLKTSMWYVIISNDLLLIGEPQELA